MNGVEEGREPYTEEHPLRPKNIIEKVHEGIRAAQMGLHISGARRSRSVEPGLFVRKFLKSGAHSGSSSSTATRTSQRVQTFMKGKFHP